LRLKSPNEIYTKYYVRVEVEDRVGVLSAISTILGENSISIGSFLQKQSKNEKNATLLFSTHLCYEKDIQNAIKKIKEFKFVKKNPIMIRIEE